MLRGFAGADLYGLREEAVLREGYCLALWLQRERAGRLAGLPLSGTDIRTLRLRLELHGDQLRSG
jgi:hypothetical protein